MLLSRLQGQVASRPVAAARPVPVHRVVVCKAATADVVTKGKDVTTDKVEETVDLPDVQPSTQEVTKFLNTLVSETSIAELHLQVGNFELKVRRSLGGAAAAAAAAPAPAAAAAAAAPAYTAPQTVVIAKPPPSAMLTLEESVDESLVTVISPKVGIFRRGKYAGGKRVGKGNVVNSGDSVKKGAALGYVEQLGTFVPVEAPQAGEVVKFLLNDGEPVEYKQEVVEMAPFFGGHIIGDSKYA